MDLTEIPLQSDVKYQGCILTVTEDRVSLPNGSISTREVVRHPDGVAILPLASDGSAILVRQYRYPCAQTLLEVPAGKLDPGEDHHAAALRELMEETGATPDSLTYLGSAYSSPGFCDEMLHLYLAQELHFGPCHPDEDEFLEPVRVPFSTLVSRVMNGEILDLKTVAVVLKARAFLDL